MRSWTTKGRLAAGDADVPRSWIVAIIGGAVVSAILAIAFGMIAGCYPQPPVNPPTCAEDPTQDWCLPPAFAVRPAGADAGCRRSPGHRGRVVMSCDDHEPVSDGVDMVVDASGRGWSACAWNSCGRDPNCRARLFKKDGGAW